MLLLSTQDILSLLPALIALGTAVLLVVVDLCIPQGRVWRMNVLILLALLGTLAAGWAIFPLWGRDLRGFGGSIRSDDFSLAFQLLSLLITAFILLIGAHNLKDRQLQLGEFTALMLFACASMMLLVSAGDLLVLFIALETLSITSYILCGFAQQDVRSNESALKYFLLGAFASGFLLYGIMMLYGSTGSLKLEHIAYALSHGSASTSPMSRLGLGLLLAGFGFKLALAPFHMWTPDVYEGAPTSVTAFLSAAPKAVGFAALARVLFEALPLLQEIWSPVLWVLAVLTMSVGNVAALWQENIKRMLAYSSIAHAGYILVAFTAGNTSGLSAVLFYSLVYALMNTGVFSVLVIVSDEKAERLRYAEFAGMGYTHPLLGAAMFLFMLSLAGIPLTAGFAGKFHVFRAALDSGYVWLSVIGVLNSVISVYYYLRIVVVMYMQPATEAAQLRRPGFQLLPAIVLAATVGGVLYLGFFPSALLHLATSSVAALGG